MAEEQIPFSFNMTVLAVAAPTSIPATNIDKCLSLSDFGTSPHLPDKRDRSHMVSLLETKILSIRSAAFTVQSGTPDTQKQL
jgi:hypothetical protein